MTSWWFRTTLTSDRFGSAAAASAVAALSFLAYLASLANGFALDDVAIIQQNNYVHGLSNLRAVLFGSYWPDSAELYRPLTMLSFAVDWTISGGNPFWFHLVNVLLHVAVTLLVWAVIRRLGDPGAGATLGAALFAIHPVHVEAVANIVGRAEMLASGFFLAAILLHLCKDLRPGGRSLAVGVCYFFALSAKESAISLPAILLLVDLFFVRTEPVRSLLRLTRSELATYAACALALAGHLALRVNAIGSVGGSAAVSYLDGLSTADRLATAVRLWPEFIRLLFWPRNLAWDWGPAVISPTTWADPMVYLGLGIGMLAVAIGFVSWNRQRWISLSIGWFGITFFVVSQIPFAIGVMLAERHLYIPSIAVSLLLPGLVALLSSAALPARRLAIVVFVVAVALGSWRTWERIPAWHSTSAAYMTLGREHPESYRAAWYAAGVMLGMDRVPEAIVLYRRAVDLTKRRFYDLNLDFAEALLSAGENLEAEAILGTSIDIAPNGARAYLFLARSLTERSEYRQVVELLENGKRASLDSEQYRLAFAHHLALAYDGLGMLDSALAWRLIGIEDGHQSPLYQEWLHLARLRRLRGEPDLATHALENARRAAPDSVRHLIPSDAVPLLESPMVRGWGEIQGLAGS